MGLFRKTLTDLGKLVDKKELVKARQVLDDHINTEHTTEGDLAGVAASIHVYQQKLLEAKAKLTALNAGSKKTSAAEVKKDIATAQAELVKMQALISKLRSDARLKLM